jgi:lambda repressor-like predicted transcriptional regulator
LLAEKLVLQEISQKILTNKLWIDAIHSAIKDSIQIRSKGISGKIKSKERTVKDLRQKVSRLIDQIEDKSPIPELRLRLEKRTEELHQAELELQELRIRIDKTISIPNRDWVLDKLGNLDNLIDGSIDSGNRALRNLLESPISVVPIKIPGKKRCFLRGTLRFRAGKIATVLTGINSENIQNDLVEELVIDFKDTTFRDQRRQKIADLHRNGGWSIRKISEKVGISLRYASELLKEDYQLKNEKIPDFRGSNRHDRNTTGIEIALH